MFAAGCAICGTKLDPHRADRPGNLVARLAGSLKRRNRTPRPRAHG
jgi:hypothetical protein